MRGGTLCTAEISGFELWLNSCFCRSWRRRNVGRLLAAAQAAERTNPCGGCVEAGAVEWLSYCTHCGGRGVALCVDAALVHCVVLLCCFAFPSSDSGV